jgi:hypothetical protein
MSVHVIESYLKPIVVQLGIDSRRSSSLPQWKRTIKPGRREHLNARGQCLNEHQRNRNSHS